MIPNPLAFLWACLGKNNLPILQLFNVIFWMLTLIRCFRQLKLDHFITLERQEILKLLLDVTSDPKPNYRLIKQFCSSKQGSTRTAQGEREREREILRLFYSKCCQICWFDYPKPKGKQQREKFYKTQIIDNEPLFAWWKPHLNDNFHNFLLTEEWLKGLGLKVGANQDGSATTLNNALKVSF